MNAFRRLPCPHCGASLAPSRRTKVLFAVFVGALPFYVLGMLLLREQFAPGALRDLLFGIAILLLIFVACYWVWHSGSYALDPHPETAHRPTRHVLWKMLGLVFVACLLVWMAPDAYRNAVLLFEGRDAVARVVRTERTESEFLRPGEIRLHYEFADAFVKIHAGVATFGLKQPRTEEQFLHVVYWTRDPTINMLKSRLMYTNLLPVILGVVALILLVRNLVHSLCSPEPECAADGEFGTAGNNAMAQGANQSPETAVDPSLPRSNP